MWLVLAVLCLLIVWALWFILGYPLGLAIGASIALALGVAIAFAVRAIRGRMASQGLEAAIAGQGAHQADGARPDRRPEILALQGQIQAGIAALKSSKLGAQKKSGTAALYALPWYVIVGPPGAGKTTALKHSGLVFPFDAQGVRGVGGTRNCDWWFTNDAILLDTAGRYAIEHEDRDEWLAFLAMLLRYRPRRPINGVLVAISITDILDASESQIEAMGKKLRSRIDEVMTELKMVVPVYVLFTKCDLIAGFSEIFGDLRRSDRAQALGATLKLDVPKAQPGQLFDAEFDLLLARIHARALRRLTSERSRDAREKIYQFPLEMAGLKRNASDLVATLFMVNAFQGTPVFRGFYFTSGTQEGRPLDRVLGRMGHAMGLRPQEPAATPVVESKSFFLYDVFAKVAFPDADIAARSQGEIRRQMLVRLAVSAAAVALALMLVVPAIVSFANNRSFQRQTEERAKAAASIAWNDGRPAVDKLALLDPVLDQLSSLDAWRGDGVPLGMGWFMYEGDRLYRPTVRLYVTSMQQGFVLPCKLKLEERLRAVNGDSYRRERLDLKTYLMLVKDPDHLDVDWATGRLTQLWAELLRPTTNMPEVDLKKALRPHVRFYLGLLKDKKVVPVPASDELIEKTRRTLQSVPVAKRYYEMFVSALEDEKYDEGGESSRENRKYPPFTLGDMFQDRPDVLRVLTSKQFAREQHWKEVAGPYTEKGHLTVVENVADGGLLLEREKWVVPLADDERLDKVPENLKRLAEAYDAAYVTQWNDWFADLSVASPSSVKDAIDAYGTLTRPDWPYLRILRALQDHTQWKKEKSAFNADAGLALVNEKLSQKAQMATGLRVNVDIKKLGERVSVVPATFKRTVEFGIPEASGVAPITDTPLAKFVDLMAGLRNEMIKLSDRNGSVDVHMLDQQIADARASAEALLGPFDDKAKLLLTPLVMAPLQLSTGPRLAPAGQARPSLPSTPRLNLPGKLRRP